MYNNHIGPEGSHLMLQASCNKPEGCSGGHWCNIWTIADGVRGDRGVRTELVYGLCVHVILHDKQSAFVEVHCQLHRVAVVARCYDACGFGCLLFRLLLCFLLLCIPLLHQQACIRSPGAS